MHHLDLLHQYRLWLQAANSSPRTVAARVDGARRLLDGVDHDPTKITPTTVMRYVTSVEAAWSRHTYYQHAASFHAFLLARGEASGFMAGVPKPRTPRTIPRPIAVDELRAALVVATVRQAMMLLLASFAGLRVSEIATVRGEDVTDSIFVDGKGGSQWMVPTHPCIAAAAAHFPRYGWWFANRAGEPMSRISVYRNMTEPLRLIGSKASPHQCRHLYGTALLEAGVDLRTVQVAMRHLHLSSTERYTLVTDARLRAAIAALPSLV